MAIKSCKAYVVASRSSTYVDSRIFGNLEEAEEWAIWNPQQELTWVSVKGELAEDGMLSDEQMAEAWNKVREIMNKMLNLQNMYQRRVVRERANNKERSKKLWR